jgi:hypothetical protein
MNTIPEHINNEIERLFSAIAPWESAYTDASLSYFAVRKRGTIYLLQGRLFLHTAPSAIPHTQFESARLLAGNFYLSVLGVNFRELIVQLFSTGGLETPAGKLIFPKSANAGGSLHANFDGFNRDAIAGGNRLSVLTITGDGLQTYIDQPDFDWELKACSRPFDSLNELIAEYSLAGNQSSSAIFEVVATSVAAIDAKSTVDGEEGTILINLAKTLDPAKCYIGYRVLLHSKTEARGNILSNVINWSELEHFRQGAGKVSIPKGAALNCFACYNGFAHHQYWIADPKNYQNSRRVLLEEFHGGLGVLQSYLFDEQRRGKDARDFEFGIAWLLWMLGFSTSQVGGRENTSDAADIVATTPSGNILIVECTTGLLKSDKVAKLVERSEIVRKRLISSGNHHLRVLPVIVTSKPKDEVKADIEEVRNKGVAVVTKENLESALSQTIVLPNAEMIFDSLWQEIQPKQNKLNFLNR